MFYVESKNQDSNYEEWLKIVLLKYLKIYIYINTYHYNINYIENKNIKIGLFK